MRKWTVKRGTKKPSMIDQKHEQMYEQLCEIEEMHRLRWFEIDGWQTGFYAETETSAATPGAALPAAATHEVWVCCDGSNKFNEMTPLTSLGLCS